MNDAAPKTTCEKTGTIYFLDENNRLWLIPLISRAREIYGKPRMAQSQYTANIEAAKRLLKLENVNNVIINDIQVSRVTN